MGQRSGLPCGEFLLRVSPEVAVKLLARTAVIWRLSWGWRIHFQAHTGGRQQTSVPHWLLAWRPRFLATEGSPWGCSTWQLAFPGVGDERERERERMKWNQHSFIVKSWNWYTITSTVLNLLEASTKSRPSSRRGDHIRARRLGGRDHWKTS